MESRGSTVLGLGQLVPPFGDRQRQKPEEEEEEEVLPWRGGRRNSSSSSHKGEKEEKVAAAALSSSGLIAGGGRFTLEPSEEEAAALLELRRHRGRSLSLPSSPNLAAARLFRDDGAEESASASVEGCCTKCKKRVQFADSLGFCLASVKHFSAAEEPQVPPAVLSRLQSFPMRRKDLEEFSAVLAGLSGCPGFPPRMAAAPSTTTMAPSQTPLRLDPRPERAAAAESARRVSLEEVSGTAVSGAPSEVMGVVRVQGCPGPKEVTVRYTFNEWLSFLDAAATPTTTTRAPPSSPTPDDDDYSDDNAPSSELYGFSLCLPPGLEEGTAIHFAICYRSQQGEFWDNNGGANYTLRAGGGGGGGSPQD